MSTIIEQLESLANTKDGFKTVLQEAGTPVPSTTPFNDYVTLTKTTIANAGSSDSTQDSVYVRPIDRPSIPSINTNEIYMLFGVTANGSNDYAIILTAVDTYNVNWGDGVIETIPSGTKCEHVYNYSTLNVTPTSEGIKYVWIKFSVTSGNFITIDHNARHSLRPVSVSTSIFVPQIYEIHLNAPEVSTWIWTNTIYTRFYSLDIFNWVGSNKLTTLEYFFSHCYSLKKFNMYTSLCENFSRFLYNCRSLNQPINIDTSKGLQFSAFMSTCNSQNKQVTVDTSKALKLDSFMNGCTSYSYGVTVDLLSTTSAVGTTFIGAGNPSQTSLRLLNMGSLHTALTITGSNLNTTELVNLFNDLYDRSTATAGTLNITGVFGSNRLTKAQLAIATAKNWTVTGASTID